MRISRILLLLIAIGASACQVSELEEAPAKPSRQVDSSSSPNYTFIVYDHGNFRTCSALICDSSRKANCESRDGFLTIAKKTNENHVYISHFPAESENDRNISTSIQVENSPKIATMPVQNYPETWVVPSKRQSDSLLNWMRQRDADGDVLVNVQTGDFPVRRFVVRDLAGIEAKLKTECPAK